MELIVGHENLDFDSLAACVAAQRLHPGSTIGLPRRLARPVRDFWSLHKERFAAERLTSIDPEVVERLVVVDVRDRRRLKHVEKILARRDAGEAVDVHVYDHHPASPEDVTGSVEVVEPVGAVTTILLERIRARELAIDPLEATLYALALYTDTASLTLATTTPRDAAQIGWLLEQGASLSMVNRYLAPPFSDGQRAALAEVLETTRTHEIRGVRIGIARIAVTEAVDGLAEVVSEACQLEEHDALFTICEVRRKTKTKVQVVARARSARVDVGGALRAIGGGGHRGAGSAAPKTDADATLAALEDALVDAVQSPKVIGDLMSSPVRSLSPDLTLAEAGETLARWNHTGAPVVRDGELLGVLSKRDVAKAREAGREDLPVSSHMSGQVLTAAPSTPVEEALAKMVDADVGRLLVMREDKLIGIVSRTDLLATLYPEG